MEDGAAQVPALQGDDGVKEVVVHGVEDQRREHRVADKRRPVQRGEALVNDPRSGDAAGATKRTVAGRGNVVVGDEVGIGHGRRARQLSGRRVVSRDGRKVATTAAREVSNHVLGVAECERRREPQRGGDRRDVCGDGGRHGQGRCDCALVVVVVVVLLVVGLTARLLVLGPSRW